jgi:hypothetical protein
MPDRRRREAVGENALGSWRVPLKYVKAAALNVLVVFLGVGMERSGRQITSASDPTLIFVSEWCHCRMACIGAPWRSRGGMHLGM